MKQTRDPLLDFYNQDDASRWGREMAVGVPDWIRARSGVAVEVGCGVGPVKLPDSFCVLTDIAHQPLVRIGPGARVQCDAQRLPFREKSVDTYLSIAAYEHLVAPDVALEEMDRMLRPDGIAYLAPAWNCRSWTHTGVTVKSYRHLPLKHRFLKMSLVLRERVLFRALMLLPRRLLREFRFWMGRPIRLQFKPLQPNLEEYLTSDSDASAAIDPHAAVVTLKSWGYEVFSHPGMSSRLRARADPVIAGRPSR